MTWTKIGKLAQVPPGNVVEAKIDGLELAICNVEGDLRVVGGVCPHAGGPLGYGTLEGECVVCPYHAWGFSTRTGEWDGNPETKVAVYEAKVEDGGIYVKLGRHRA